jgi:hypothetical protein
VSTLNSKLAAFMIFNETELHAAERPPDPDFQEQRNEQSGHSRRTVIIVATAIVLGFTDLTARGQNPHQGSISLGSVTLVLGMSQDAAMAALAARYSLTNLGNTGNAFIVRNNNGPPFHMFGSLASAKATAL